LLLGLLQLLLPLLQCPSMRLLSCPAGSLLLCQLLLCGLQHLALGL
jgi:hypothetical protein